MHKHKSKSKSHRWGPWSEWTWDVTQQAYVRVRQDTEGVRDYEWDQPSLNVDQTPRDSAIEDITERLGSLSPGTHDAQSDEYACVGEFSERQKSSKHGKSKEKEREKERERKKEKENAKEKEKSKDKAKEKHKDRDRGRDKGKGKGKEKERERDRPQHRRADSDEKDSYSSQDDTEQEQQEPYLQDVHYAQTLRTSGYQESHSLVSQPEALYAKTTGSGVNYTNVAGDGEAIYEGVTATEGAVPSSSRSYHGAAYSYAESSSAAATGYGGDYPVSQLEDAQDDYHLSPAAVTHASELDPRYRIEHSTKFQPGEIFKACWPEPHGSTSDQTKASSSKNTETPNKFGTNFFVGFRRFIIVANDQGHATCVPILTYGGKGCKKNGVKPEKHGIIHERNQKAKKLDGEPSMGFHPVRAEMTEEGEKLSRESRVNYSKLVTVEHNFPVFFIGRVYLSDWQIVLDAVDYCWNQKIRQLQRRR